MGRTTLGEGWSEWCSRSEDVDFFEENRRCRGPVVDGNKVKVVAPVQRTIGGSGKDGVVPPVVDRNVAGVPDPRMLSSTRKIDGGEESYVVSP
ncbi:hypothetical protein HAX54_023301, partial [Datura stramonium]|nr:hypothetical protein [Datura stramonium]